jgi:hypothetical protein
VAAAWTAAASAGCVGRCAAAGRWAAAAEVAVAVAIAVAVLLGACERAVRQRLWRSSQRLLRGDARMPFEGTAAGLGVCACIFLAGRIGLVRRGRRTAWAPIAAVCGVPCVAVPINREFATAASFACHAF